jgi:hypothetical protein
MFMEWLILFIISWLLFFILVDFKKLRIHVWSGLLAAFIQLVFDAKALSTELYRIPGSTLKLWGSPIYFTFGLVFVVGVLFSQYHPQKNQLIIAHVFVITILYTLTEILLVQRGAVIYLSWNILNSLLINSGVILILSWFSIILFHQKGEGAKR